MAIGWPLSASPTCVGVSGTSSIASYGALWPERVALGMHRVEDLPMPQMAWIRCTSRRCVLRIALHDDDQHAVKFRRQQDPRSDQLEVADDH